MSSNLTPRDLPSRRLLALEGGIAGSGEGTPATEPNAIQTILPTEWSGWESFTFGFLIGWVMFVLVAAVLFVASVIWP